MLKISKKTFFLSFILNAAIAWVILQPTVKVNADGDFELEVQPITSEELYIEELTATVTAYTSSEDETDADPFITASGDHVAHGTLACPARYAFGTEVLISGKKYICNDRMNDRYSNGKYFDIWMSDYSEAVKFGRQQLRIRILK